MVSLGLHLPFPQVGALVQHVVDVLCPRESVLLASPGLSYNRTLFVCAVDSRYIAILAISYTAAKLLGLVD